MVRVMDEALTPEEASVMTAEMVGVVVLTNELLAGVKLLIVGGMTSGI